MFIVGDYVQKWQFLSLLNLLFLFEMRWTDRQTEQIHIPSTMSWLELLSEKLDSKLVMLLRCSGWWCNWLGWFLVWRNSKSTTKLTIDITSCKWHVFLVQIPQKNILYLFTRILLKCTKPHFSIIYLMHF